MRLLAHARNPYSLRWLWIPGSLVSLAPRNDGRHWMCASTKNETAQILGVIQLAIISPSVDDTAVTNAPHVTSMITTGHVQCSNSDSDVSSQVASQKKPNSAPYS